MANGPIFYIGDGAAPSNTTDLGRIAQWNKQGNDPVNRSNMFGSPIGDLNEVQIWTDTYTLGETSAANSVPRFYSAENNPAEFLRIVSRLSGQNITNIISAVSWLSSQSNITLVNEGIALDGLILNYESTEWDGGSIIYDTTGNSNNGTPLDDLLNHANGFYFDGTGEVDGSPTGGFIQVNESITSTLNREMTYEIWMHPLASGRRSIFFGGGSIRHIECYHGSGSFRTEAATQNGYSFGASGAGNVGVDFGPNKWSLLTITFGTDGLVKWYANGQLFHTGNMYGGNGGSNEYFSFSGIGRATGTSSYLYAQSFHGYMDGIKLYDRVLTASEVAKNFNARAAKYGL